MHTKLTKVLIGAAITVPLLALQSFHIYKNATHGNPSSNIQRSSGLGSTLSMDRTGSPISNGSTCTACHSQEGSFTNILTSVLVKNANNETVDSYLPGETLTIEVTVSADGSPTGYGSQLTVLDDSNEMAGDLVSVETSETQIATVNAIKYLEHDGRSSTGIFKAVYKAPSEGTGTITLYGIGLAANGSGSGNSGDNVSNAITLSLAEGVAEEEEEEEEETPTSLEEHDFSTKLSAYPNPSNGLYNIELGSQYSNITTKLCSTSGEVLSTKNYQNINSIQMLIDEPAGVYFLVIETENNRGSIRLIKD
tara:strand:- start:270 stop:1193 length:924 start_codon:yes stop_codon:yes gene_type:complete